jgi:AcrR family transcriptional regulator
MMGRPAKLSRVGLQKAALGLVDRRGLSGLSMRSLAARVGSGPMSLYNHVANRADLELLVVEAVVEKVAWRRETSADWRTAVRELAVAFWRTLRAHPHVLPLILTRRSRSPALLEVSEALLDALARSGRSGAELLAAFRAIQSLIMGFVQVELAGPLSRAAGERPQAVIRRFRALPPERYPLLIEIATAAMTSEAEDEFRAGLELLLRGLDASGSIRADPVDRQRSPAT